jgi:hypothetical protein
LIWENDRNAITWSGAPGSVVIVMPRELGVSVKTVEKHIGDAYQRLGVRSRAALGATILA